MKAPPIHTGTFLAIIGRTAGGQTIPVLKRESLRVVPHETPSTACVAGIIPGPDATTFGILAYTLSVWVPYLIVQRVVAQLEFLCLRAAAWFRPLDVTKFGSMKSRATWPSLITLPIWQHAPRTLMIPPLFPVKAWTTRCELTYPADTLTDVSPAVRTPADYSLLNDRTVLRSVGESLLRRKIFRATSSKEPKSELYSLAELRRPLSGSSLSTTVRRSLRSLLTRVPQSLPCLEVSAFTPTSALA